MRPRPATWFGIGLFSVSLSFGAEPPRPKADADPSPIALAISADGSRLLVANQGTNSVALVDLSAGKVLTQLVTGDKPAGVALSKDGRRGVVSHWYGYDLAILDVSPAGLKISGRVSVGPEPRGVVLSDDGRSAYVAGGAANEVVRVDLAANNVTGRLAVGREPRGIALTPDGKTLVVGNARSKSFTTIDVGSWAVKATLPIDGVNLRQVAIGHDGKHAYVPNMFNRGMATTPNNIDLGWVLGQRLTRVAIDGSTPFETLTLDTRGNAVADVHGIALLPSGRGFAVSSGGTHELLLFRTEPSPIPWRSQGSRDLIPGELLQGDGRFRRVALGGRPTELALSPDGATVYIANYLSNSIQAVDFASATLTRTIDLGGPKHPSLVRRGETLFHEAKRSFNQWYSCNTCHPDGHTNGADFDTMNDGWHDYSTAHLNSRKKVPTLRRVALTGPWTWHGWQKSLDDAMIESFTKSMQGQRPTPSEVKEIVAFIGTLEYPRNPNLDHDGGLSPSARRGEAIFRSTKTGCASCHSGPEFTDGKIHVVGLEGRGDVYRGFNPPSLKGVYDKDPYLHDGRSATLKDALLGPHNPEEFAGGQALNDAEMDDLIAYLKSL